MAVPSIVPVRHLRTRLPARAVRAGSLDRRLFRLPCFMGVILALSTAPATAQVVNPSLWVPNGQVNAIVKDGSTIYIGGSFTRVSPRPGGGAALNATTGEIIQPFARIRGPVDAVASDG